MVNKFSKILKYKPFKRIDAWLFAGINKWKFIKVWMINPFFYKILKIIRFREGEHQIGRLLNLKRIIKTIKNNNLPGDIIEFGSHQGYYLFWIVKLIDRFHITERKIIGIDSFEGLPESSTMWIKGQFDDTSVEICKKLLCRFLNIKRIEDKNIFLIKGWFNDPIVKAEINNQLGSILLAHIDCDLGSSCTDALSIIDLANKEKEFFLLFDDWFLQEEEIPKSVQNFRIQYPHKYLFNPISQTVWTSYFQVTLKN